MVPIVAEHGAELESLCRKYNVLRLELFGSAATGEYHTADSDLDFLVEFQELPTGGYANAYFGLLDALDQLFGRPVDLIVDSAIENPTSASPWTGPRSCCMQLEAKAFFYDIQQAASCQSRSSRLCWE